MYYEYKSLPCIRAQCVSEKVTEKIIFNCYAENLITDSQIKF